MTETTAVVEVPPVSIEAAAQSEMTKAAEAKAAEHRKKRRMQENAPIEQVPLTRINATIYPNYRKLSSNEDIENYVESIRKNGLKQNLVGGLQPDGSIGLACGFQRFESIERLAVEDVVAEYNKHFNYTPKDDGYIFLSGETLALNPRGVKDWRADTAVMRANRRRIRDVSPDWAKKYDDALLAFWEGKVPIQVKKYKNASEAMIDNIEENELRSQPSLADKTARIIAMLADGMSPGAVATAIGQSGATVSHYKRIADLLPYLTGLKEDHEKIITAAGTKAPSGDEELFLRKMDVCIAEVDRRWKLPETDPCNLQFQQLRECSNLVDPAKEDKKLPLQVIFDIVAMMVRVDKDSKATDLPSFDQSTFKAKAKDIIEFDKLKREEAQKKAEAAANPQAAAPALNIDASSAEDAALLQSMSVSTGEASPTSGTAGLAQGAPLPQTAMTPPSDAQRQANIDAANAQLEAATGGVGTSTDDLMAGMAAPSASEVAEVIGPAPTSPEDGAMRAKTAEPNRSRYTLLPPDKIESLGDILIKGMSNPEEAEATTPYDCVQYLATAKQLYYVLGLSAKSDAVNEVLVDYVERLIAYMTKLEEAAAGLSVDKKMALMSMKPQLPVVKLPE